MPTFADDDDAYSGEFYDDAEREEQNAHGIVGDEDDYGVCPICGNGGEMLAQGRTHWIVCHADRVKWRAGSGFFSWFKFGKSEKWDKAGDWIKEFREVAADKLADDDDDVARLKRMME